MLNTITIIGRLTKDVDSRKTNNGTPVCSFFLAFNQGLNADGTDNTGFIQVNCWESLAESSSNWLQKGDKVVVSGRLIDRPFEAKDGSKRHSFEIVAGTIEFVDVLKTRTEQKEELPFDEPKPEPEPKPVAKPSRNRR